MTTTKRTLARAVSPAVARLGLGLLVVALGLCLSTTASAQNIDLIESEQADAQQQGEGEATEGEGEGEATEGEQDQQTQASSLRRGNRMEFDARLIRGESAGSGAVFLFERGQRPLPSMIDKRKSFLRESVGSVLGSDWAEKFDEAQSQKTTE